MKTIFALALVASLSGCAAFCNDGDYNCINRANSMAAGVAAVGLATLGAAAAVAAAKQPTYYVEPVYVVPVRRCYGYGCY